MSIQSERKSFTGRLNRQFLIAVGLTLVAAVSCQRTYQRRGALVVTPPPSVAQPLPPNASPQLKQFVEAAIEQK